MQLAQVDAAAAAPSEAADVGLQLAAVDAPELPVDKGPAAAPLLFVSSQSAAELLGGDRSSRSASALGDLRSGNPHRMASAVSAAR